MQNTGDNDLQLRLRTLEKEIKALERRSEVLETEKRRAVLDLLGEATHAAETMNTRRFRQLIDNDASKLVAASVAVKN